MAALLATVGGALGGFLATVVQIIAAFLVQAALVKAVQDVRDGRADLSLGETVSAATPSLGTVAIASILAGIVISIGLALLIVPGLILLTIWAVIVPVIVIERSGALASFGRSRQLVRGSGWHVRHVRAGVRDPYCRRNRPRRHLGGAAAAGAELDQRPGAGTLIAPFLALVVTLMYYRLVAVRVGPGPDGGYPGRSPGTIARPGATRHSAAMALASHHDPFRDLLFDF